MATIADAEKLVRLVWPGRLTGVRVTEPFPGHVRAVAAHYSRHDSLALDRVMVEAGDRRAALAGLCAALREMSGEGK